MKQHEEDKKELKAFGFPKNRTKLLIGLITLDNYRVHMKAREKLVEEGEDILPVMHKLCESHSDIIRREAAKILKILAHHSSIPVSIRLLEDRESEVRWIAAEILIAVGRKSIKPLLRELVVNGTSFFMRHGAHHVLSELITDKDTEELRDFLHVTLNGNELPEIIPVKAARILKHYRADPPMPAGRKAE